MMRGVSTTQRAQWVDVAKGGAIVLVLLHHSWETLDGGRQGIPLWGLVDQALASMRMPTFFMISGLFAARAVTGTSAGIWRRKVALFGYLYALWSAFYTAFHAARAAIAGESGWTAAKETVVRALTLNSKLWYLPALAIFFVLAFALRALPARVQLAVAGAALVPFALRFVESGSWGVDRMAQYFFWFLVGCHGSVRILRAAERVSWPVVAVLAFAWTAAGAGLLKVLGRGWHFGDLLLPFFAVPLAVAASVVAARWVITGPLAFLGRNTLPVYVLHDAAILLTISVLPGVGQDLDPPLVTVVATAGCIVAARILRPRRYLFSLPAATRPQP